MRILRPREKKRKGKKKKQSPSITHSSARQWNSRHPLSKPIDRRVVVEHFQKLQAQEATFGGVRERTETERREQGRYQIIYTFLAPGLIDAERAGQPVVFKLCADTLKHPPVAPVTKV